MTMNDGEGFSKSEYRIKILLARKKFQDGIYALRQKWQVPDEGFPDNKAMNAWRESLAESKGVELRTDLLQFLRELELAERWYQGVYLYLQTGNPYMLRVQSATPVRLQSDGGDILDKKNVHSVWIQIDTETTEREVREAFKYAQSLFNLPKKKSQQLENFDRDLEALRKRNNGESITSIAEWLNNNYEGDFNSDDAAKIIKRIKRRLE